VRHQIAARGHPSLRGDQQPRSKPRGMLFCKVWIVCGIHTPYILSQCRLYVCSEERSQAAGYESRVRINAARYNYRRFRNASTRPAKATVSFFASFTKEFDSGEPSTASISTAFRKVAALKESRWSLARLR
jgi:hypothetical protein